MRDREEENPEIYALKEEIELCHRKLEGLDEIIDKLKAENERLRKAAEEVLRCFDLDSRYSIGFEIACENLRNAMKETK